MCLVKMLWFEFSAFCNYGTFARKNKIAVNELVCLK
jgi:hypothetical protein